MEEELIQVARDLDSRGNLDQAVATLESLYDRRYCFKNCLTMLGGMEVKRKAYPKAMIYCREVMNG